MPEFPHGIQNDRAGRAETADGRKDETLTRLCDLPRLSPSASRLLGVPNDDSALEKFEAIFGGDPSLAVELLRVANSALYHRHGTISNLRTALAFLGVDETRNLAIAISLSSFMRKGLSEVQIRPIWQHSLATAVIAEQIGRCMAPGMADLYTAGLMHDLGRLGLLQMEGERYGATLADTFSSVDEANAIEKGIFGLTHAEAGGHLSKAWGFPPLLCLSIRSHHDCPGEDDSMLVRINQQACILATELGYPELPNCPIPKADPGFVEKYLNFPQLSHDRLKDRIVLRIDQG